MISHRASSPRHTPRRAASAALTALATAIVATSACAAPAAPLAGVGASAETAERALRDHALDALDGGPTRTLGDLRGDVVVVNFWASWCGPCRRELPRLSAARAQLESLDARVVAISIDENPENARRFCRANRVTLPVVHDGPDGLAEALALEHVPFTLVLDRAGRIAYTTSGSDATALAAIVTEVRRLSQEPMPAAAAETRDTR